MGVDPVAKDLSGMSTIHAASMGHQLEVVKVGHTHPPTQVTDLCLDLNPVRQKARSKLMTLDQFNLQDIIQKTVEKAEADAQEHGETIITTAGENCLFYANPYVLHQSPINNSDNIIRRSFVRLLYTVDERDRIGDTVSPVIGPCYPFKIKTIFYNYQVTYKCLIKLT